MLRGTNKRIIEINDTGSEFFEKALFFVKADSDYKHRDLTKEAEGILKTYFASDGEKQMGFLRYTDKKKTRKKIAFSVLGALVLAVTFGALYYLY